MQFLDLTLTEMAENLALDEALLEEAESQTQASETLRTWYARLPCVVLGRSSRVQNEVDQSLANQLDIPIFRRMSGGATVVAGPGCMFYALLLSLEQHPHLRMLDQAHLYVMQRLQDALRPLLPNVELNGTCDLVLHNKKISGNSLRVGRNWMLYHGTLLLAMDLSLIDRLLKHPPREPEYRAGRHHRDFIDNCHLSYSSVSEALRLVWQANEPLHTIPAERVECLVREKYSQPAWNFQR